MKQLSPNLYNWRPAEDQLYSDGPSTSECALDSLWRVDEVSYLETAQEKAGKYFIAAAPRDAANASVFFMVSSAHRSRAAAATAGEFGPV